jgi:hypothetical protein
MKGGEYIEIDGEEIVVVLALHTPKESSQVIQEAIQHMIAYILSNKYPPSHTA